MNFEVVNKELFKELRSYLKDTEIIIDKAKELRSQLINELETTVFEEGKDCDREELLNKVNGLVSITNILKDNIKEVVRNG